jgi:integrase/recombinase XerD
LLLSSKRKKSRRAAGDGTLATAIRLMVSTGMRVGELCKVHIEDISLDGSSLRIHGKGSRERVAYISDVGLRGELLQLAHAQQATKTCEAVFVNRYGFPMKPSQFDPSFDVILVKPILLGA